MKKLLNRFSVDGYNPFNGFNLFLAAVSGPAILCGCILPWLCVVVGGLPSQEVSDIFYGTDTSKTVMQGFVIAGIVCFLLLLFRNRKLKSIPKMIIYSVISSALGVLIAIVAIFLFGLAIFFKDLREKFGGGSTSGSKWTKQYSNSKGEYYTDGQGNFKDQYGNDVYNPQGVSDYNKL